MSSLSIPSPSRVSSGAFHLKWTDFVNEVLDITIKAYLQMRAAKGLLSSMEEDAFTARLVEDFMIPLGRDHPLGLVVEIQRPLYTRAMKLGKHSSKRAKKVDIRVIFPRWHYVSIYFGWECKRIADKTLNSHYSNLTSEYVTEGIQRFIDGEYSSDVDHAGMLGYVLCGMPADIVKQINSSIGAKRRSRPLAVSNQLTISPSLRGFTDVYISEHNRSTSSTLIKLIHLFLTFDYE